MKDNIIKEITTELSTLGITADRSQETDLVIDKEFLDAKWSTGEKKLRYENNIFINEQDQTVYMYEKTTETGKGLSFGDDSDSSFQSGTTLHRKIKIVQYGPEGKAYEIELDLGTIPKTVKNIAEKHGYKFKTVISKKKSLYPVGYVGVSEKDDDQTTPVMPAPPIIDNKREEATGDNKNVRNKPSRRILIELGILFLLVAFVFLILEVNIIGWLFLTGILVALYFSFVGRFFYKALVRIILLVVSFLFLFIVGTLASGSGDSNGDGGGNGAGKNQKDISGFEIKASGEWEVDIKEEDDLYVITKIDDNKTASVDVWYNKLDQGIYDQEEIDFDKVTLYGYSGFTKISEDRIKIGKWNCVRMLLDANTKLGDLEYYRYFYLVDVPGNRDIMLIIGAGGLDYIKSLGAEWEGYISKIKLNY